MRQNQLLFSWKLLSTFKTSGIRIRIQLHSNFDQHTFFQAKVLISSLRLEPAVFIFYICYGIFFVTNQQLYIEKACKVHMMSIITRYFARKPPSPPASSSWRSTLATTPVCATTSESSQKFKWSHRSWSQRCRWWTKPPGLPNGNAHCTYLDIAHFCLFFFLSQILDYGQGSERSTAEPTNHCCRLLCRANLWQVSSTLMPISDRSPVPSCQSLTSHDHLIHSDRFSRKPLILVSLGGYLLLNIIYAVNAFWFYELKVFRPRPPNLSQQI